MNQLNLAESMPCVSQAFTVNIGDLAKRLTTTTPEGVVFEDFPVLNGETTSFEFSPYDGSMGMHLGTTTEVLNGEGYHLKGLFLGDYNLSDGSGLIKGLWKEAMPDVSSMRMTLQKNDDKLGVYYEVLLPTGWASLGKAFDLDVVAKFKGKELKTETPWFACLRTNKGSADTFVKTYNSKEMTVEVQRCTTLPSDTRTVPLSKGFFQGSYKCETMNIGPELGGFTKVNRELLVKVTATPVSGDSNKLHVSMVLKSSKGEYGNTISSTVEITDSSVYSKKVKWGNVLTTQMMPSPKIQEVEQILLNQIKGITEIRSGETGVVLLSPSFQMECTPEIDNHHVVTQ